MDKESLAQIEQIVGGTEGRLRSEMRALGASLREEFSEKTETLAASLRQEYGEGMHSLRQELAEKTEEVTRHSGVLHEDVLRKLVWLLKDTRAFLSRSGSWMRRLSVNPLRRER